MTPRRFRDHGEEITAALAAFHREPAFERRKVARILDRPTGTLYLNCPCGARPTVPTDRADTATVRCACGQHYTTAGWVLR